MSMITLLQADPKLRTDPQYASQLLDKLLLAFGGSPFFFSNEEKVAFLLDLTLPTDSEQGVNFDIRLAYALVTLVRKHKAGAVEFFYQPAPGFTGEQILEKSGYQALAELNDVRLTDLTGCPTVSRRSMTGLTGDQVEIYAPLAQADVVISLAKYKAAQGKLFGSALRSLMICTPTQYEEEFQDRALVDLYSVITPDLFILDGLLGKKGFQPQQANCLLGAADAVSADAVLATLAHIPAAQVGSLCLAAQYGLGVGDPGGIALYGDDLAQLM